MLMLVETNAPITHSYTTHIRFEQGVAWTFDAPTATDNSGNATITILSTVTNVTGHCGSTFEVRRTWQATEACVKSSFCSHKCKVDDTNEPIITCSNTNKTVDKD